MAVQTPKIPEEIVRLSEQPRVTVRRAGAPLAEGRCVVYWMQRAQRVTGNPALDVAIAAGNLLGLPVVVFFAVVANFPNANLRHFHFMAQGLRDVAEDAAALGVSFQLRIAEKNALEQFLASSGAALLIGDENPLREPERWRRVLAGRLRLPYWTVDADVVVPSQIFDRSFVLMHHFRPHLKAALPQFLVEPDAIAPLYRWCLQADSRVPEDLTASLTQLDRSVEPVESITGGAHEALRRMRAFVNLDLGAYDEQRNRPERSGTSRLSPYLHFGQIGPLTVALAVEEAVREGKISSATREKFLEQLIGWRELSVLFVRHEPNYDNWDCAAPWAKKTLIEHAADPRPYRYNFRQLDRAETEDELWNAAQREMVRGGWMHGTMRMYWAKKILEWAPEPATAFEWAVTLNDRYQLDGRDANGYAGIAWSIVGRHDRPWFNRPVFGLVRPMTAGATAKKFDAALYQRKNERQNG